MKQKEGFSEKFLAIVFLLISSALFPFFSIVARLIDPGLPPLTQIYLRLTGSLLLALIFFHKHIRLDVIKKLPLKDWLWLFSMGVIGLALAVYFFIRGAIQEKLLNVTVIGGTDIFMVYILSLIIFKEKFKPRILFYIIFSLIGVAFLATKSFIPTFGAFGKGDIFILLSALSSATYIISRKLLSQNLNDFEITVTTMTIGIISTFLLSTITGEQAHFSNLTQSSILLGLLLGAVLNVIVMPLENFAFKHTSGVLATQILLSANLFSLMYGYLFYREIVGFPEIIGASLILISVYLTNKSLTNS